MKKHSTNDLKKYIKTLYGTQANCARRLGVTTMSVHNWHMKNPRAMLKHAPEIVSQVNTTWTQLSAEVLAREEELNS